MAHTKEKVLERIVKDIIRHRKDWPQPLKLPIIMRKYYRILTSLNLIASDVIDELDKTGRIILVRSRKGASYLYEPEALEGRELFDLQCDVTDWEES